MTRAGQPISLLCGSVLGRAQGGDSAAAWPLEITKEEAVSWHLPYCQSFHFLPFSPYATGALPAVDLVLNPRGGGVYVSPKTIVVPLRGVSWESHSFFHCPNPHWFLQPEVMGTYLPGSGTLGCMVWSGSGITCSQGIPPNLYPALVSVGLPVPLTLWVTPRLHVLRISASPTHLDEYDFFKSLVVCLPFSSIFWRIWVIFVL